MALIIYFMFHIFLMIHNMDFYFFIQMFYIFHKIFHQFKSVIIHYSILFHYQLKYFINLKIKLKIIFFINQ